MVGFAFFATIINYLDRQVLSVVAASPDFKAAVPLTRGSLWVRGLCVHARLYRHEWPFGAVY